MSRIQIENGYALCVMHRKPYTHLLLEQTLSDGSVVLHGEKRLSQEDLMSFFAELGNEAEAIRASFTSRKIVAI